jgi:hypothetical protein
VWLCNAAWRWLACCLAPTWAAAVLFWSLRTEGTLDKGSMHGSCPVIKGRKQAATKWFHVAHYAMGGEQAVAVKHTTFVPPPPPTPPGERAPRPTAFFEICGCRC